MNKLVALYGKCVDLLSKLGWLPPLLARITVGLIFAESGWGKMHNIDKVAEFFVSLNLPAPVFQAHLVAYTELIAGVLVLVGLATRAASIPLIITMVVAIVTVKLSEVNGFSDLLAMSEYLYIVLLIWLLIDGAGKVALDHILKKKIKS